MESLFVLGLAGCGKSRKLARYILSRKHSCVVLAPTHAAVNNLKNMVKSLGEDIDENRFQTIHKYFRISPGNFNFVQTPKDIPKYIFIDEVGMVDKDILNKIYSIMKDKLDVKIICSGDVLQLQPVNLNESITFTELADLFDSECSRDIKIIKHLHNSFFTSDLFRKRGGVKLLTHNHRQDVGGNLGENMNNIFSYLMGNVDKIELKDFSTDHSPLAYLRQGFVLIASRYKILQKYYSILFENFEREYYVIVHQNISYKTGFKKLYLKPGMKIITTINTEKYHNGDEFTVLSYDVFSEQIICSGGLVIEKIEDEFENLYFPVTPANFLTIHKSQGKTIDEVVLCLDDMFGLGMAYTGMTRAKKQLVIFGDETAPTQRNILEVLNLSALRDLFNSTYSLIEKE
jgi:hypothetical protein